MGKLKDNVYVAVIINFLIKLSGLNLIGNIFLTKKFRYLIKFILQYVFIKILITINVGIFSWFIMIHSFVLSIFVFPFIVYYSIKWVLKLNRRFDKEKYFII